MEPITTKSRTDFCKAPKVQGGAVVFSTNRLLPLSSRVMTHVIVLEDTVKRKTTTDQQQ